METINVRDLWNERDDEGYTPLHRFLLSPNINNTEQFRYILNSFIIYFGNNNLNINDILQPQGNLRNISELLNDPQTNPRLGPDQNNDLENAIRTELIQLNVIQHQAINENDEIPQNELIQSHENLTDDGGGLYVSEEENNENPRRRIENVRQAGILSQNFISSNSSRDSIKEEKEDSEKLKNFNLKNKKL